MKRLTRCARRDKRWRSAPMRHGLTSSSAPAQEGRRDRRHRQARPRRRFPQKRRPRRWRRALRSSRKWRARRASRSTIAAPRTLVACVAVCGSCLPNSAWKTWPRAAPRNVGAGVVEQAPGEGKSPSSRSRRHRVALRSCGCRRRAAPRTWSRALLYAGCVRGRRTRPRVRCPRCRTG